MERPANMMPNGMPPQGANMNTMQRPQPGNPHQQIHAQIMTNLRNKTGGLPPGWQTTFDIGQRAQAIMQLVSALRLIDPRIPSCIRVAETFEEQTILDSPSKDVYMQKLSAKLQEVKAKRMEKMQMQQGPMNMQMNNGMGMPQNNMGMGNGNMMQNNGMGGMGMGMNMNMNQGLNVPGGSEGQQNHGFPAQLQRPMQASPLPPQQHNQPSNGTLNPSALQNNNQMSNFGQAGQQPPQQNINMNANQQNQQANPLQAQIQAVARQLMTTTPEDKKSVMRQQFLNQLDDQKKQQVLASGRDPLFTFFMMQANEMVRKRQAGQAAQGSLPQQGNGMQMGGVAMQQTPSQSGAPNFDFTSIIGQQASAIKSQESGGEVVPASNNGNSMSLGGGQMNMSQGVNPQAVTNQNGQGGNNAQLQQLLAQQQEKARQEQMRQQNQNAQNQAMLQQQAQQLRGQPGGLNAQNLFGNNNQVNSPAMNMNMLNRPMAPPGGQPAPSTPQQPRPGMGQTPVNNANQLAQHHQNMLNQNVQQGQGQGQGQGVQGMPTREQMINMMPAAARDKLLALPPQQLDLVLARQFQNMTNRNGAQPPMSGMPGNMGSAVPQFNSQPNQNQQQQPQQPQQAPDQLQQRLQQHQNSQLRQRALDLMTLPKAVLPSLGLSVPDTVNTWGKLKQHIQANHAVLPPNLLQKLQTMQQQYYEQHPDEVQQAMRNWAQQMQQMQQARQAQQQGQPNQQPPQQAPPARPASSMAMPNGQAPQAQMVPPGMQLQAGQPVQTPNAGQQVRIPPVQPPTPAEIQQVRQNIPNAQHLSDDQLRAYIMQRRAQQAGQQQIQAQQQAALRAQMQRAQALNGGQQQQVATGQQPPNSGPGNQAPQAQRPQQPQPPGKPQTAQAQGQKRQQSDDVVEIPKPTTEGIPPANVSQQAQQGMPQMPSQEELNKMNPAQRQAFAQKIRQMEALRKAQNPMQNQAQANQPARAQAPPAQTQGQQPPAQSGPSVEIQAKLRSIYADIAAQNPKGKAVQLDAKSLEMAKTMLKKLQSAVQALMPTLSMAMRAPNFGEQRVREAIRNVWLVQQNAVNANGEIKDYLSLNLADLKQIETFIGKYFVDMKALKEQVQAANGGQTQQAQARPQQPTKAQEPPAAKSNQQAARKASAASTKAPPAPTENKTFDWGSPSPHGVPKYEGNRTELTSDKLKLPASKKRKTNQTDSQEAKSTPASVSAAASPKVDSKAQSKDQAPKMQPSQSMQKPPEPEKATFKCDDVFCDASVNGFETEAQLKEHKEIEHRPIEDPLQFMLESAAKFFEVDQDGNPLPEKKDAKAATASKPANKKDIPGAKSATTTLSGKAAPKSSNDKSAESAIAKPQKEKTLYEEMCEKVGFELPAKKEEPAPPSISIQTEDEDAWLTQLSNDLSEFNDAFGDLKPDWCPSQADWDALPKGTWEPSPELTPSDRTSDSSHSSDISTNDRLRMNFEWDAFGNGDTYVPEVLRQKKLVSGQGLKSGDITMQDADKQEGEKKEDPWDWSDDVIDYDAWFENGNDKLFDASEAF